MLSGTHDGSTDAIDHNQYIKGRYTYQANYSAGLRIQRLVGLVSGNLQETAYLDIFPGDNGVVASQPQALHPQHDEGDAVFDGAWSVYPYFSSGVVVVSGIEGGLFVLRPRLGGGGGASHVELGGDTAAETAAASPAVSPRAPSEAPVNTDDADARPGRQLSPRRSGAADRRPFERDGVRRPGILR